MKLEPHENDEEFEKHLKTDGMAHHKKDIHLSALRHEFQNLHTFFEQELKEEFKNFNDVFKLFKKVAKSEHKHDTLLPNLWTLLRQVIVNSVTTASCERSFRLNSLIKTDLRSTMTDERMNHLCVLKHYKDLLMEIDMK